MTVNPIQTPARKNLIFDADDTLWENNIYFIEATEAFLDYMESARLDREETRRHLTETEQSFIAEHGYGTGGFTRSLVTTARSLIPEIDDAGIQHVQSLGHAIVGRDPMQLLPGVADALKHLAQHNRLFCLTKGDESEQRDKLNRSRLASYFEYVDVVREKDADAYRRLITQLGLDPSMTWMIGNSPRSDINPALAAGLNAVLVPHPQTWEMELEDLSLDASDRLTIAERITDLIELFAPPSA